jgi:hypothetical protein
MGNMKPILVASLLACMIVTSSQFCHADLIMQFGSGGTIGVSTISAAPGSSLIVHHFVCKKTLALAGAIIGDGGRKK